MKSYNIPDYSRYTRKELYNAYYVVNRKSYPDNFRAIINELKRRNETLPEGDIEIEEEPVKVITEPEEIPVIAPKPLPITSIIGDTLSIVWNKKLILLRSLVLPYSLVIVIGSIQAYLTANTGIVIGAFAKLLGSLVTSLVASLYIITCHRIIILGENSVPKYGILMPKSREFRFWGWTIGISLLFFVCSLVAMFIVHGITNMQAMLFPGTLIKTQIPVELLLILLPGLYIFAGLTLIFPAVAVDKRPSMGWAWKQSSNNRLRLSFILLAPLFIFFGLHYFTKNTSSLLFSGATIIVNFVTAIIAVILISLSYKEIYLEGSTKV